MAESESASEAEWHGLMDADIKLGTDQGSTLKSQLYEKLLKPWAYQEATSVAKMLPNNANLQYELSSRKPLYSLILFGPPGKF